MLPFGISNGLRTFTINPVSGQITFASDLPLNLEMASQYLLTIRASDMGRPSRSDLHTLILVPTLSLHELPGALSIDEELPLGTVVAELSCEEIGPPTYSTSITLSGQGSNFLRVVERSNLIVAERMNYESLSDNEREFNVTATCSNQFEQTDTIIITVIINNVNDNVFQFEHLRHTLVVSENLTVGEEVLMVSAEDNDLPNANITYSLEPASDFMITPHTGEIVSHSSLDRETQALYQFTVHAAYTNMTGLVETTTSSVTIHIADINDESPIFEQSVYDVRNITDANEPGDLVLIVSASDPDTGSGGTVTYHFSEESSNFEINETTGAIFISSLLTYHLYVLNITATDGGEDPMSSTALIFIHSSLYQALQTLADDIIVVNEDIPVGSVIGNVSYAVLDNSNATLNDTSRVEVLFEIVNASVPFGINATTGEIHTLGSLDYETLATEYNFIVRATLFAPTHELVDERVIRIAVGNIDDTPPVFSMSLYVATTEQFTGPNITILSVSAMDPDALNNTEYFLSNDNSSIFQIGPLTGEISATELLDVPKDYRFTVVAMDSGAGEANTSVFISVNAAPVFIAESFTFPLSESAPPGTIVGRVTDGFEDDTGEIAFLVGVPDVEVFTNISESIFQIDATSGNISTLDMVDHESIEEYVFSVAMYNVNTGTVYYTATVVVQIEDENDNPPIFTLSLYTRAIEDTQEPNSIVTVVSATDRDAGSNGQVIYLFGEESMIAEFEVNSTSGEISTSNLTLLPGLYNLTVVASDEGSPPLRAETTVFINVIPFVPEAIEFSKRVHNFQVVEMAPPGTLIGVVQATEFNSTLTPPSLTYSWPNITNCFNIDTQSGEIRVSCVSLDRESVGDYELVVTAEVGNVTTYAIVMVSVLDINDNTPEFSLDVYTEIINSTSNFTNAILQLLAVDRDFGYNGTVLYNIVSETDEDIFWINSTSGEIFLVDDAIEVGDYVFIVRATDMGNMSSNVSVFIHITNPHPQTLRFANLYLNISENSPVNSSAGFVVLETNEGEVIDPLDFPNDLYFSIIGGDLPGLFSVDEYTGEIRIEMTLDHEAAVLHVIEIQANFTRFDDVPIQSITASFTVTVLDENDNAPWILRTLATTIDDNAHGNQVLFNITAMDIDSVPNARVSFSVDSPVAFAVRVTGTNPPFTFGEIFVNDTDSLVAGVYRFTLTATDSGTPPMQNTTMVTVIVQHAIPEMIHFSSPNYTFSILEETPEGTPVGNVSVLPDTPALDSLVYAITGGSGREFFSIDVATGEIQKRSRRIDRERNSMFHLDLQAFLPEQDPPLNTMATVTIIIEDINDHSPYFINFPAEVTQYEGATRDEVVYTFSAYDVDSGSNSELRYALLSSTFNDTLTVNPLSGQLVASVNLDREGPLRDRAHDLIIQVCDSGSVPRCVMSTTLFRLLDVNDNPPLLRSGFTYNASERTPEQTHVFSFVGMDPDAGANGTIRYYLNSTTPFTCNETTGQVSLMRELDYEARASYRLELILTDMGDPILSTFYNNISVSVTNLPDDAPCFNQSSYSHAISAAASAGEVLFRVQATDADIVSSNDTLRYAITDIQVSRNNGDYPRLKISANTGEISSNALQVFTPGAEFVISVLVYDQSAFNLTNVTTLLIRVLYNSLAFTDVEYSVRVLEDVPLGSLIARLDLDPLSVTPDVRYDFRVIEPALQPSLIPFTLSSNGTSVLLTLDRQRLGLNRELIDRFVVEVSASQQNESAQTTLRIEVTDVNDNSPMLVDPPGTVIWISQYTAIHTPVARVNATDPDSGENSRLDFHMVGRNVNIPFEINRTTGDIQTSGPLDTDGILPSYDITVYVRDAGQPRLETHITYTINIGNSPESTELPTTTVLIVVLVVLLIAITAITITLIVVMIRNKKR